MVSSVLRAFYARHARSGLTGSLRGSFPPRTSNPLATRYATRGRAKRRCRNTARGGRWPTRHFRVLRNPERSAAHVIATPPRRVPRVPSDISCQCRGTHLFSWSHSYSPPELMRPQRATIIATLLAKFEEGADELARIIDSEHASWVQTDGTSLLEHRHASVACLKTSCRLPISICRF